ncbi:helix-turn-helix domain-containing protein, partial [Leptospira alstonii]
YISVIPLSMGFIFFGNMISNLFLNVNLNYLSYLVYGIVLIFLYHINSKTSVASILPKQPAPTDAVKQGSQLLKEIDISNVEEKLNSFIEAKQYRDSNFRLSDLSLHLGISLHQTSCYLNQHKGISFNDFINHFRIEEAKRIILKSNHNINLNDIALASGFNSYTSFHRSFKKITGISPSRFGKASGGAP